VELERSSPITDPARPWVTHYDSVLSRLPAAGLGAESWPAEVGAPVCLIELSQLADQGAICPEFLSKWPSSHLMNVVHKVESCLGYKFRCPWLCLQALTHETCCNEDWDCDDGLTHLPAHSYQRLEFLGDAVLCSVVTTMLYVLDCRLTPADLTVRKSYCICNSTLASVALEKLSLHRCLRASSHVLEYVETAIQRDRTQGNGSGSYLPKTLADGFEALAAAVYLDRNASIAAVRHVFWPLLKEYAEDGSRALGRSCQTSRAACGHVNEVFVGGGGNHGASSPSP
jgi:dsRNA-specific ribonuclease